MKIAIISTALLSLSLSSCQSLNTDKLNAAIQANLPGTCRLMERLHTAFILSVTSGKIPDKLISREAAAYNTGAAICSDPQSVTVENAPILAAQIYLTLTSISKQAKEYTE